jgi:DNA-binding MarR family transcriptional regulator
MKSDSRGIVGQVARVRELANDWLERELEARAIEGIQPAHGTVLAFLFKQQSPVPIKEIVEDVRRVKSTVTGMVNTLERHGYVRKTPSEDDGRVVYVELTEKGNALRADFDEISENLLSTVYGEMSQKDRESLSRLLRQVEKNLRVSCTTVSSK